MSKFKKGDRATILKGFYRGYGVRIIDENLRSVKGRNICEVKVNHMENLFLHFYEDYLDKIDDITENEKFLELFE